MQPIQTKRYASPKGFSPATAPNTAEQQRRQDEEFIRQLKETRDIELRQEAEMIARVKNNNQIERTNLRDVGAQEEAYQRQQDEIKSNQIEREYREQQAVTGGVNASDKKFNDALDLVKNLSSTASDLAVGIGNKIKAESEAAAEAAFNEQLANGFAAGQASPEAIEEKEIQAGGFKQETVLLETEARQNSIAAQFDREGTPESRAMAYQMRQGNGYYKNALKKAYARHLGKNYATQELARLQELKLNNPEAEIIINGKAVAASTLDLGDPQTASMAIGAGIPGFLKKNGFEGDSNLILGGFYNEVASSQQQIVGTLRNAEIEVQKADIVDQAESIFKLEATPLNAKQLYTTYTQQGYSAKESRSKMVAQMAALPQDQFDAVLDSPFGPNGLSFREQYPLDTQSAISQRNTFIESNQQAQKFVRESENEQFAIEFNNARMSDLEGDGTFDADPATLSDLAQQRELVGDTKGAALVRSAIPMTQSKQYDKSFLTSLQTDMELGVSNFTVQQIQNNQSLSPEAKREALKLVKNAEANAVPTDIKTRDGGIIKAALKNKIGDNPMKKGTAHFTLKIAEINAMNDYARVYRSELNRTGDSSLAAEAALQDFYSKLNDKEGKYKVGDVLDSEPAIFTEFDTTGKAYDPSKQLFEIDAKVHERGVGVFTAEPELYKGETKDLNNMVQSSTKTGRLHVPDTIRRAHQQFGGTMSLRQLVNQRLEANGLDPLSNEVGKLAEEVEMSFDPVYNTLLNYRPNSTRTDIAAIGSGQDPIYEARIPANLKDDVEFTSAVTKTAQDLGISESALYAVMDFETGGSFNPGTRNAAGSGATGLIQFMPETARDLGTTTEALSKMSRAQQMTYVSYYLQNKVKPGMDASDVYMSVLFPAAVGKPDDFVLFGNGAMSGYTDGAYAQNAGLDLNKDGRITKAEAAAKVVGAERTWRQRRNMRPELQGVQ